MMSAENAAGVAVPMPVCVKFRPMLGGGDEGRLHSLMGAWRTCRATSWPSMPGRPIPAIAQRALRQNPLQIRRLDHRDGAIAVQFLPSLGKGDVEAFLASLYALRQQAVALVIHENGRGSPHLAPGRTVTAPARGVLHSDMRHSFRLQWGKHTRFINLEFKHDDRTHDLG